jgi:hypothetical protein
LTAKQGGKQSDLVAHIEEAADYDGLAVVWGIKNTKKTAEECAEHCKRHMPKQVAGGVHGLGGCRVGEGWVLGRWGGFQKKTPVLLLYQHQRHRGL